MNRNVSALLISIIHWLPLMAAAQPSHLLFHETFADNTNSWLIGDRAKTNAQITNGTFYLESKRAGYNYSRRTEQGFIRNNQDYEIEIRIRQVKGNASRGYGLEWGGNSLENSFYEFWLRNDGHYSIDRFDDPSQSFDDYVPWTFSTAIKISEFNILKVRKEGNQMTFSINERVVFNSPKLSMEGAEVGFIAPPLGAVEVDYIKISLLGDAPKPIFQQKSTSKIFALLVGIAEYKHNESINDLKFTVNDVNALSNFYQSKNGGGLPTESLTVLTNEQATKANILHQLKSLFDQASPNDMVIFYYSGHGDLIGNKSPKPLHLIPYDFNQSEPTSALHHEEIEAIFNDSKANKKLWMMDACHSGGSLPLLEGRIQSHLSSLVDKDIAILTSSNVGETSIEASSIGEGRGLFSFYLTNGLIYHSEACDQNQNGIVSILELYNYVSNEVSKNAYQKYRHYQHPQIGGRFNIQLPMAEVSR